MAFSDPAALTYNAVAKNLNRNNQDGYGSTFFLDDSGNLFKFSLEIKHTIPAAGKPGESHMIRLYVEEYDASLVLLRTTSAWLAIRTDDGAQAQLSAERAANCLVAFLTAGNVTKLVGRQN
jgi:hypothetical protein